MTKHKFITGVLWVGTLTGFVLLLGTFGHWEIEGLTKLELFAQITYSLLIMCGFGYALVNHLRS